MPAPVESRMRWDSPYHAPVLVGENIYAINEAGKAFVFLAQPKAFKSVATSQLGDEVFATPTICDSRIYLRVAENTDGGRQEMLYCLGKQESKQTATPD